MKPTIILIAVCILAAVALLLTACGKRGPEADAAAAIDRGEYQFVALMDPDAKWTRPEFLDIPAWYFETTGIRIRTTRALPALPDRKR
jgi:hypothetical protein